MSESDNTDLERKIEVVSKLAQIKNKVLVIVDDASQIEGTTDITIPVIEQDDLKNFSSSSDLLKLVEKGARKTKQEKEDTL